MADKAAIHHLHLELDDGRKGESVELNLTIARHPSETVEYLLARLLAYALNYRPGLAFSKGVCEGNQPAIVLRNNGRYEVWIDVGQPSAGRLAKALRYADSVIVYAFGRGLEQWQSRQLGKIADSERLHVYGLDERWLRQVAPSLSRRMQWQLSVAGDDVQLRCAGQAYGEESLPLWRM